MKMTDVEILEKKIHGLPRYEIEFTLTGSGKKVKAETYLKEAVDSIITGATENIFVMNDKGEYVDIEKRAEWLLNPMSEAIVCGNCFREAYWDTCGRQMLFDYCPVCGARMKHQEEKDGDREGNNDGK